MMSEDVRISIFPFTVSYFENTNYFEHYLRETLPDILTIEHTQLRKPNIIIFAYQGDKNLWGYAEIENWESPPSEAEAEVGVEWGGSKFRRLYKIKHCSIREFKKHVSYTFLRGFGFETRNIIYAPSISIELFNQVKDMADGEINLCLH
jgi:hypothetical protein